MTVTRFPRAPTTAAPAAEASFLVNIQTGSIVGAGRLAAIVLDFDANGALVGIDVQHASERADLSNLSLSKLPFGELLAA